MPIPFETRVLIAFLWTFVSLNMVFADVLGLFAPGTLAQVSAGVIEGVTMTDTLLLVAAAFIQVALGMIVATLLLPARACRGINTMAVVITIAFVVGGGSLKPHYLFLAGCELIALSAIAYLLWRSPSLAQQPR